MSSVDSHSAEFQEAVRRLQKGEPVAIPTETVYGLAANAMDAEAVARIYATKERPSFNPLIVHVAGARDAIRYAVVNRYAESLMAAFWPGPLTLVLPRLPRIPALVSSGLDSVALRCPDHDLAREVIRESGLPLAAPSANKFGHLSPTTAEHVREEFADEVFVLDGGACRVGLESTVLSLLEQPIILRAGAIDAEQIEKIIGVKPMIANNDERDQHLPREAPGMLASHYAPKMPLYLYKSEDDFPEDQDAGYCFISAHESSRERERYDKVEILSKHADLVEVASNLFEALHRLEALDVSAIHCAMVPNEGIGLAINDRLRKASYR